MAGTKDRLFGITASTLLVAATFTARISCQFTITNTGDTERADVAYSTQGSSYLAVWSRIVGGVSQIRGQRFGTGGALQGGTIVFTSGLTDKANPAVAYVAKTKRFLVVWQAREGLKWRIKGRSVNPLTGSLSPTASLAVGTTSDAIEPALAGSRTTHENDAILAWRFTNSGIRVREIDVPSSGAPSGGTFHILSTNKADRTPALPKSGGDPRRFVVAWVRGNVSFMSDNIHARALDDDGRPEGTELIVAGGMGFDRAPKIDGNGYRFLIAWEHQQNFTTNRADIHARVLRHNGLQLSFAGERMTVAGKSTEDERYPTVGFLGNKLAVAWTSPHPSGSRWLNHQLFSPTRGLPCSPVYKSIFSQRRRVHPVLGSRFAAGSDADEAMLVFVEELLNEGDRGLLKGKRIEGIGNGNPFTNLRGGCGLGGLLTANGPFVVGNTFFKLSLSGAAPSASVSILNIAAAGPAWLTCGVCDISQPTVLLPVPIANGNVNVALPLPCRPELAGLQLQFQHYVLGSGTTPCSAFEGISVSNRIQNIISN